MLLDANDFVVDVLSVVGCGKNRMMVPTFAPKRSLPPGLMIMGDMFRIVSICMYEGVGDKEISRDLCSLLLWDDQTTADVSTNMQIGSAHSTIWRSYSAYALTL